MFEAYFLDQGRVDAILLGCDGEWMFIDSGFRSDGLQCVEKIKKYLNIDTMKIYCISHLHRNHVAGAAPIIEAFKPDIIYANRSNAKEIILKYASTKNEKKQIEETPIKILKPGNKFMLGGADITCLGPLKLKDCSAGAYAENGNSLILKVFYKGRTMLLTGDTSSTILNNIHSKNEGCLKSEVYKNAHHAGNQSEATLKKIKPIITIICNATPPSSKYQNLLSKIGSKCYTACKKDAANMKVWTDGTKWNVEDHCFKK